MVEILAGIIVAGIVAGIVIVAAIGLTMGAGMLIGYILQFIGDLVSWPWVRYRARQDKLAAEQDWLERQRRLREMLGTEEPSEPHRW